MNMFASASASAFALSTPLININDFSYIIIDIGSIGLTEFIHTSANRYVDELSVEARVISGQYSAPELLDSIRDCVKTYATDDLLSQVPEETTYVITDADLGNFLEHKLVVYFPDRLGHFYDLISLIGHLKSAIPEQDQHPRSTYEMSAISFAKATRGNIVIASLSD